MQRFRAVLLALGVAALMCGLGAGVLAERAHERLEHELAMTAASRAAEVDQYFAHAQTVMLLAARSPVFGDLYRGPDSARDKVRADSPAAHRVLDALAYLRQVYPDGLVEAGAVEASGTENARITRRGVADPEDLVSDRSSAPFFGPTFRLQFGKVYQSAPYTSASTGQWVITTATKVDAGLGPAPALVYLELAIEEIRLALYDADTSRQVRIVDLHTGRIIIDSTVPVEPTAMPSVPHDRALRWVRGSADTTVRQMGAWHHAVKQAEHTPENANRWAVVVTSPTISGPWATSGSIGPLTCLVVGLLLLALSVLGYLAHGQSMHRAARRDELTGLANRLAVREHAESRLRSRHCVTVLLLDLDRFKRVNDTLGHAAGDELLAVMAQRLGEVVREAGDLVARLGGDEFVVLIEGTLGPDAIDIMCTRIIDTVTAPVTIDGVEVMVGTSIGVAVSPDHGTDYGSLLRCADIAMYYAKVRRSGWQLYRSGLSSDSKADIEAQAELRHAVSAGQLEVHFQPSFDLRAGSLSGAEALVRWRHPLRGLLLPGHFIPMAEANGSIRAVTIAVLDQALDQHVRWLAEGKVIPVSVNISAHDLTDPAFAEQVLAALTVRGLDGSALLIELTETALLADTESAQVMLETIAAAGVGIAVDDFGSGYASLIYLRRYPVTVLKLDRSMIQGISDSATDLALARWTVEMAHSLRIRCVAEGIEDSRTLATIRDLGCDDAQGFFLQAPVPAHRLLPLLADKGWSVPGEQGHRQLLHEPG